MHEKTHSFFTVEIEVLFFVLIVLEFFRWMLILR